MISRIAISSERSGEIAFKELNPNETLRSTHEGSDKSTDDR